MASKRILIVEDDRYIREALQELLESEGYSVELAVNGEDALKRLRSLQTDRELPGLIFLDLMMPVKDGFSFREEQLREPRLAEIPTVIMSADGHVKEKKARAIADTYLKKPVDLDEIVETAKRYCG